MSVVSILAALVALLLAALLAAYVVVLARRRASVTPAGAAPQSDSTPAAAAAGLVPGVLAALAGREEGGPAYHAPLVLLTGEPESGKSALLQDGDAASAAPLRWHKLPQGWILSADTAYLGLDDQEGAQAWQALAEQLQRRRPRRPLDGVVLTIAADTLAGPKAWPAPELERRAALAQRRLGEMQSLFGLRLPVYVVITRADKLDGFSSFASALPEGLRQAMLGWSSVYGVEEAFGAAWIAEGVGQLSQTVTELQAEISAAGAAPEDDSFYLLPAAIASLAAPLRRYAGRLLGENAHTVVPMFRGLYLCGDPAPHSSAGPARPWFARDLLERKVFRERGLAQPLGGQILSRNKLVRRWAAACAVVILLWGGALAWTWRDLHINSEAITTALRGINDEAAVRKQRLKEEAHLPLDWYQASARRIITAAADNRGDLSYAAIPASWNWAGGEELAPRIQKQFGVGLGNVVYRVLDKGLNQQAGKITGNIGDPISTELSESPPCGVQAVAGGFALGTGMPLADTTPFRRLSKFVADAGEFAKVRERLDRLQSAHKGNYDDLVKVAAYSDVFDMPAPPKRGPGMLLRNALDDANRGRNADEYRRRQKASLECAFRAETNLFFASTLDQHPALDAVRTIGEQLRSGQTISKDGQYRQLIPSLQALGKWLQAPTLRWLDDPETGEGKAFGDLLKSVGSNQMLGGEQEQWARGEQKRHALLLEEALLQAEGPGGQAILQRSAHGGFEFTPELAALKSGLDRLLAQPFMVAPPDVKPVAQDKAGPLWEIKALNGDLALADTAQAYLNKELPRFPVQFQAELKHFTGQRLANNLLANALQAQRAAGSEAEAYEQAGQAQKQLSALLDSLRALDAEPQRTTLARIVARQATRGLEWLERDLKTGLYRPRDDGFGWWQGAANPAAQGFAGGDPQGLEEYLQAQQARVEAAARQAEPLLRLLEASEGDQHTAVARRWAAITAELARYQEKQPNARIAQLHAYIRGELAETDGSKCLAGAAPRAASLSFGGSDIFSERRSALAAALARRCRELAGMGYEDLRNLFQRTLANRFPFADADREGEPADPGDVQNYLQLYKKTALDSQRMAPGRARDFVAATAGVSAFVDPLLPAGAAGEVPGYELAVRFRVGSGGEADGNNALAGEIGGNRISAWTLQSGDERISWTSTSKPVVQTLPWRPGMPLVLTLRWADNVAALPYADGADRYMSVSGREVVYRYSEPWSLLRMLARQRVPRPEAARYETLRFEIPMAPAGAGVKSADARTRVFLRMAVMPAQKKEVLAWPRFPSAVPGDDKPVLLARP